MHIKSFLFYLKNTSARKLTNLLLLKTTYYLSIYFKKNLHKGYPIAISVEPTNYCNLNCPECPSGNNSLKRSRGLMTMDTFYKTIMQLNNYLMHINLFFQGEPFINNEIYNMICFANSKGIYTSTSTNLHCLTQKNALKTVKSGLKHIIVSVDGINEQTYTMYRKGGSFSKVLEGLDNLLYAKKELNSFFPYIEAQCLILKSNEESLKQIKHFLKSKGADKVTFKTAQFENFEQGNELMPQKNKSRYFKNLNGTYEIKNKLPNKCWRMWNSSVITWDGTIVPCCFDKHSAYPMGNVNKQGLSATLSNIKYNNFRSAILLNRKNIDICKNCSEGLKK